MSIQSTINQGISVASLLISQNPAVQSKAKDRAEFRNLTKQEKALNKTIESLGDDLAAKEPYGEQLADVKKRQFELKPSAETLKAYKDVKPERVAETPADPYEIARERIETEEAEEEINSIVRAARKARNATLAAQEERRNARAAIMTGVPESYPTPRERIKYGEE